MNVYILRPFTSGLLYELMDKLASSAPVKILMAGDFNNILDYTLDTSNLQCAHNLELVDWAASVGLTGVWRWKHPQFKRYSHLSLEHASSSKIDLAFSSSDLLPLIMEASCLPVGLSDYSPLQVVLRLADSRFSGSWRLSPDSVCDPLVDGVIQPSLQSYWQINEGSSTTQLIWDAFKATVRGEYISAIKAARTQHSHDTEILQENNRHAFRYTLTLLHPHITGRPTSG